MLEVGNGMTAVEDRTELTLWAALAAPLVIGTDLVHARPETLALLTNPGVIAIDQDPLGRPARLVSATNGLDVLSRPLAGGDTAIVLFNETDEPATIATPSPGRSMTDVWTGATTTTNGEIRAIVPAHGAMLYRVAG
jgi:alpha-galactosidase